MEGLTDMNKQRTTIDLAKLAVYILKRCWLIIICAAIGFSVMYYRASKAPDTYTASAGPARLKGCVL